MHLQHRASCIAEFTASVHRVAFTAWPAQYVAFTASQPSRVYVAITASRPAFVASTALRRGLAGIAVCWDCNMDYAVFTAPQHPSHSYCIYSIIVRRVWFGGYWRSISMDIKIADKVL